MTSRGTVDRPLRILHLEDDASDSALIQAALIDGGIRGDVRLAESRAEFEFALGQDHFDLILADFTVPSYDGSAALKTARETAPHVPFIFVSGTIGEERAVESLKSGATDYVLKDRLKRLAPAVLRALRESEESARRRQAEEKIIQLNAELERRVQERTQRLESAMKDLESFSYSVSHDLRAPLRGIDGFARALAEDHGDRLDPEGRRLLQVIRNESVRMSQLIDDLLAFSRAGRKQIDPSVIDMTELARSAFQNHAEAMRAVAPQLTLDELPVARGDRSMLRQVFANLLGNAIKFSSRRPQALIEVTGWTDAQTNTYRVKDNGVGFDGSHAHKLFCVFQRLHRQDEFEGTGVGLALVQRIIQRHGGKVWAEGAPNAGASFYFSLPVVRDETGEAR